MVGRSSYARLVADLIKDHQRVINISMGVSVSVVLGRTVLLAVPEVVPFGAEVGALLYDAGLAYATAWLFQWLVIVRPERARRASLNAVIGQRVDAVVNPCRSLVSALRRATGRPDIEWPPTEAEMQSMCAEVDVSQPPFKHGFENWWVYLRMIQHRRMVAEKALEPYYDRMDEELLVLDNNERDTGLLLASLMLPALRVDETLDLNDFAADLWVWVQAIDALRVYKETVLGYTETAIFHPIG